MSDEIEADIIEDLRLLRPPGEFDYGVWLVGAVVGAILLGLVLVWIWRKRKIGSAESHVPSIPPAVIARQRLKKVLSLMTVEQQEAFVIDLSDILRVYLEGQFGLSAPRISTEEFLYLAYQEEKLGAKIGEELGTFLHRCDRVKFSPVEIQVMEMNTLYETVSIFVENTGNASPKDDVVEEEVRQP